MTHASPPLAQPHPVPTSGAQRAPYRLAVVNVCASTALVLGLGLLAAWLAIGPAGAAWASRTMKTNTALAVSLCASSLLLRANPRGRRGAASIVADLAALAAALIGGLTLVDYLGGVRLPIHEWLAVDPHRETFNRMAPNSALCMMLLGVALLALPRRELPSVVRRRLTLTGQWLSLIVFAITVLALIGYAYDASFFYRPTHYIRMAPTTVAALILLAAAALALRPESGLARLFLSEGPGGAVCRVLLVPGIVGPALVGWLRLEAVAFGLMSRGVATAVASIVISAFFVVLIVGLARRLDGLDRMRRATVEELRQTGELTAALAGAASVSEVVEITVRIGTQALGAAAGAFFRASDDGGSLCLERSCGLPGDEAVPGHRVGL